MYRFGKGKKTILIFVSVSSNEVDYAIVKKHRILEKGKCALEELERIKQKYKIKYARVAVFSELTYIDKINIRLHNKKLLDMSVRRYINDQSIFMGEFDFKSKLIKKVGEQATVGVVALPSQDLKIVESIMDIFSVEYVVPVEIALLSYALRNKPKVKSIFWVYEGRVLDLELDDEFVVNRSLTSYEERANTESSEDLVVFKYGESNNQDEHAHLFGLLFVDAQFDFTKAEYIHENIALDLSKVLLAFSFIFFIVMFAYGAKQFFYLKHLNYEFNAKLALLNSINEEVSKENISQKEKAALFTISKYQKRALKEVDLGKFLTWITHIVPEGSTITDLEIKGSSFNKRQRNRSPVRNTPFAGNLTSGNVFDVSLELSIKGDYKTTKERAILFLDELSKKVEPLNSEFSFDKQSELGTFVTTFKLSGREF